MQKILKCKSCKLQKASKLKGKKTTFLAKLNVPISKTASERLKLTIQTYRIENKNQIEQLLEGISKSPLPISAELNNDFVSVMSDADQSKISPLIKFFWEGQQKFLKTSSSGVRCHPVIIIRDCLWLASKYALAVYNDVWYNEKTGTGFAVFYKN